MKLNFHLKLSIILHDKYWHWIFFGRIVNAIYYNYTIFSFIYISFFLNSESNKIKGDYARTRASDSKYLPAWSLSIFIGE